VEEGFIAYSNGKVIRDAIGSQGLNARSAVGITRDGDIVLAMVAQKPESATNSGISLPELAKFLSTLNVEKAMNLDGGSSSSIFYQDRTVYGKVDAEGNQIQRPIKSVLLVSENK
jgi:exopolysaccharide biosynthesis protein